MMLTPGSLAVTSGNSGRGKLVDRSPQVPEDAPSAPGNLVITEVRLRLHRGGSDGILRAFASITLNDCFVIHNLKLIERRGGFFISMPAYQDKKGGYCDIAHPLRREFRDYMEAVVYLEYERQLAFNGHP
jgi:stage V sporulation protein G